MKIDSIQVATPTDYFREQQSAINKQTVSGPIHVGKNNLSGDKQADLQVHGGRDKAVYVYPHEHYSYWSQATGLFKTSRLKLSENPNGSFGENLTVSGLTEDHAYIGDVFACGDVLLQITQPREPCWKLAFKFKQKKLPQWVITSGRTGWYMRVLQEGEINTDMSFTRIKRGCQDWSVLSCNQLYHNKKLNPEKLKSMLACEGLSESWRNSFQKRLEIAKQLQSRSKS
jgi:MOSC domain-containing protein YiiM